MLGRPGPISSHHPSLTSPMVDQHQYHSEIVRSCLTNSFTKTLHKKLSDDDDRPSWDGMGFTVGMV